MQPHEPARLLCPWNSPGKNTGVGSPAPLPGIFPTQGLNPALLHRMWILYCLSHQGACSQNKGPELAEEGQSRCAGGAAHGRHWDQRHRLGPTRGNSILCWSRDATSHTHTHAHAPETGHAGRLSPTPHGSLQPEEVPFLSWHTGPEKPPAQGLRGVPESSWSPGRAREVGAGCSRQTPAT